MKKKKNQNNVQDPAVPYIKYCNYMKLHMSDSNEY